LSAALAPFASRDLAERLLRLDPADTERILPVDALQERLTERWILPARVDLEREFLDIREGVDRDFRARAGDREAPSAVTERLAAYPMGFCLEITLAAAGEFERRTREAPSAATEALLGFRREGGHVTRLWGVLRDRYFQNAFQLGSLYFDVANDTVDTAKPKVEHMPLAESGFRNLESFAEFADVAERYWDCEIHPNRHFPRLAPLYPMLKLDRRGVVTLESSTYYMQRLNRESGYRAAETFLTASSWSKRELPGEVQARIRDFKAEHLSEDTRTPPGGIGDDALAEQCRACRASPAFTSPAFLARVLANAARIAIPAS